MAQVRGDTGTLDLLLGREIAPAVRRFDEKLFRVTSITARICRALKAALAGLDRDQVAADMGKVLGRQVSKNVLDRYVSEASEDHSIPLDRFIALVRVTKDKRLLQMIADDLGWVVVDAREAHWIEVGKYQDAAAELAKRANAAKRKAKAGLS